jgi:hypothetical protein
MEEPDDLVLPDPEPPVPTPQQGSAWEGCPFSGGDLLALALLYILPFAIAMLRSCGVTWL